MNRSKLKYGVICLVLLMFFGAYRDILTKKNTCLFSMTRTEEREALFKWVGPLAPARIVLIGPKYKNIRIDTIDDLNCFRDQGGWVLLRL